MPRPKPPAPTVPHITAISGDVERNVTWRAEYSSPADYVLVLLQRASQLRLNGGDESVAEADKLMRQARTQINVWAASYYKKQADGAAKGKDNSEQAVQTSERVDHIRAALIADGKRATAIAVENAWSDHYPDIGVPGAKTIQRHLTALKKMLQDW
ncbi:hypothetical protein [Variovorax rhizosphaerae]|uniref:Uncharacterized protein n=1 Tax=Variovorax rhizosphaerae TaxID=1836200 RepID=A0ABU8WSG4_9BURK